MFIKSVLFALFMVFASSSCFAYSEDVEFLRNQSFNACKQFYVWRVIEGYMFKTQWASGGRNSNGDMLVNVSGNLQFKNRPTKKAVMQFTIDPKTRKFKMNGYWVDGVRQSNEKSTAQVNTMCNNLLNRE